MSLRDNAFNAGKSWVSNAHASGVANARVVTYGFSKWFNNLSPSEHKSEGVTKATLLKDFKEGYSVAKRKKNPTVSVSSLPIGTWQPAHAIRQNADGSVDILREKNSGRRANISEGFMDANGHFHPIRSASDYSHRAAGEKRQYAPAKKRRSSPLKGRAYAGGVSRKKASTRPAMATSRRDYGGDGSRYRNASTRRSNGSSEVYELVSFIENDKGLYRSQGSAIIKNLAAKKGRGIYSSSKAATLYGYLVTNGAKKYAKESGDAASWNKMFTTADRKEAAKRLVENFEDEWNSGSYREYVPKKYQDKV
jgi:hypothetical protein